MPGDEAQPRNAVGIIGRIEPFEDTVETWTSSGFTDTSGWQNLYLAEKFDSSK